MVNLFLDFKAASYKLKKNLLRKGKDFIPAERWRLIQGCSGGFPVVCPCTNSGFKRILL